MIKIASPAAPFRRSWGFEWKSRATAFGLPLLHVAFGRDEHGRIRVARGVVAVGQFAAGLVTIAQFGVGLVGIGQLVAGWAGAAQLGLFSLAGVGQIVTGMVGCVGQFAIGRPLAAQVPVPVPFPLTTVLGAALSVIVIEALRRRLWRSPTSPPALRTP